VKLRHNIRAVSGALLNSIGGDLTLQATVNDSINLLLIVGCLFNSLDMSLVSKVALCHKFSIGFISYDWADKVSALCCFRISSWWPVWHNDMVHCRPSNRMDTGIAAMLIAPCVSAVVYTVAFDHIGSSIDNVQPGASIPSWGNDAFSSDVSDFPSVSQRMFGLRGEFPQFDLFPENFQIFIRQNFLRLLF